MSKDDEKVKYNYQGIDFLVNKVINEIGCHVKKLIPEDQDDYFLQSEIQHVLKSMKEEIEYDKTLWEIDSYDEQNEIQNEIEDGKLEKKCIDFLIELQNHFEELALPLGENLHAADVVDFIKRNAK